MKHSIAFLTAAVALWCTGVNADVLPATLGGTGWSRSQESFSETPSYIALHRWLLEMGFKPCKAVSYTEIQEPEPTPNKETFWYEGTYQGSPLVHIQLEFGSEPSHLGLYVQIGTRTKEELDALKQKFQPLIAESKQRVRQIVPQQKQR